MPLLITDGTTAREQHTGVIFHEGKITSGTSHVDLRWDQARSAGYGYFTLDLSGIKCEGKELALFGLSSANTPTTIGAYQGYFAHGESSGSLATSGNSGNTNNGAYFRLSAARNGLHSNRYFGYYKVNIVFPVDSSQTGTNVAPSIWWHGTSRLNGTNASHIAGGGTQTQSMSYGIRIGTDDGSTNWTLGSYVLTGYKEGGQY
jgi:hypothetical protein